MLFRQQRLDFFQTFIGRSFTAQALAHLESDFLLLVLLEQALLELSLIGVLQAVLQDGFDCPHVGVLDSHVQSGVVLVTALVLHVGLVLQQQRQDAEVALLDGQMQG